MDSRDNRGAAPEARGRYASALMWMGVNLLLFGSGPLISICVAAALGLTRDPNPHPVGPGLLALLTFWPGVGLIVAGAISTARRRRQTHS